jgi:hypothetical protein
MGGMNNRSTYGKPGRTSPGVHAPQAHVTPAPSKTPPTEVGNIPRRCAPPPSKGDLCGACILRDSHCFQGISKTPLSGLQKPSVLRRIVLALPGLLSVASSKGDLSGTPIRRASPCLLGVPKTSRLGHFEPLAARQKVLAIPGLLSVASSKGDLCGARRFRDSRVSRMPRRRHAWVSRSLRSFAE